MLDGGAFFRRDAKEECVTLGGEACFANYPARRIIVEMHSNRCWD